MSLITKSLAAKDCQFKGGVIPEANWLVGMTKPKLGLHKTWLKLLMEWCLDAICKLGLVCIFIGGP